MADLKTTIKPVGKLKSSLGASSMNVTLGRAVDWNQNDETANDYVKNRPGAYTIPNSVDIEWDGNLEGKEVIWPNTRPFDGLKFSFVKIADEAPPIEKFAVKDENAEATSYKARSITVSQRADGTIGESDETVELTVDANGKYYKLYDDIVFVLADSAEVHNGRTYTKGIWCYTATRDTTQPQGTVLKQYVRRIASTDGTVVKIPKKYLEVEDPPVKDVRIAGTSILADGVANAKLSETIGYNQYGLYIKDIANGDIDERAYGYPITGRTLDYAVKAAMCDGKGAAWTAAEQAAARDRMGLDKPYELIEEIITDGESIVERTQEPDGTAYSFSRIIVIITAPKNVETQENTIYVMFCSGNKTVSAFTAYVSNTPYFRRSAWIGQIDNGIMTLTSTEAVISYGSTLYNGATDGARIDMSPTVMMVDAPINKIRSFNTALSNLPAGFLIQIYGVRA